MDPGATPRFCKARMFPYVKLNCYSIPKTEDLFATKLDLSQVYLQLKLEEESSKYVVISTHKGRFCYTCLPYIYPLSLGYFRKPWSSCCRVFRTLPCILIILF